MVHGASGGIISQDLLYIIGEDKQQSWINQIVLSAKVQLISEYLLGLIDFPKKPRNIWQISAIESKKWSNQQSEGTFL